MKPLDILNIFLQICEAVKAFHEAKPEPLAHRDLKTANILLDDDMTPIVMDLGKKKKISKVQCKIVFIVLKIKRIYLVVLLQDLLQPQE